MKIGAILLLMACCATGAAQAQSTAGLSEPPETAIVPAFDICPEPSRWGTSADYLRNTARCAYGGSEDAGHLKRVSLIEDIFIKSWSFAVINKVAFWLSIALAILVLIWPSLVALYAPADDADDAESQEKPRRTLMQRLVTASSVQTSITALAALSFAFYAHYKGNQMTAENLMREVLYAETLDAALVDRALSAIREMDAGFGFATLKSFKSD